MYSQKCAASYMYVLVTACLVLHANSTNAMEDLEYASSKPCKLKGKMDLFTMLYFAARCFAVSKIKAFANKLKRVSDSCHTNLTIKQCHKFQQWKECLCRNFTNNFLHSYFTKNALMMEIMATCTSALAIKNQRWWGLAMKNTIWKKIKSG